MKSSMRRLVIDRLIAEKGLASFQDFEKALKVSPPTIKRDLRYMREELGAPIRFSKALGGYYYSKNAEQLINELKEQNCDDSGSSRRGRKRRVIDPFRSSDGQRSAKLLRSRLWLSSDELYTLASAYEQLGQIEGDERSAVSKNLKALRARVLDTFTAVSAMPRYFLRRVKIVDRRIPFQEPDVFGLVGGAICTKHRMEIEYHSQRTDEVTSREISPLRLVNYRNRWYVDAYCHNTEALKTFQIENITLARVLDVECKRISLDEIQKDLDTGYGLFHGKSVLTAKLHFGEDVARYVLREAWHENQKVEKLSDGSLMLSVPYSDETEIVGEILRWGPAVEVVEPAELREKVRSEALQVVAKYQESSNADL